MSFVNLWLILAGPELITCSGATNLKEGGSTSLECDGAYTGNQPSLVWLRGEEGGEREVPSDDQFDIKLARRVLAVGGVTWRDDGVRYTCRMRVGGESRDCSVTLSVTRQYCVLSILSVNTNCAFNDYFVNYVNSLA